MLQDHLPDIFESLNKKRLEITGRITSSILERKVLSVLEWWNRSSLYPPTYIGGLEATFLRPADGGASLVAVRCNGYQWLGALSLAALTFRCGRCSQGEDESKLDAHALSRKCKLAGVSPSGAHCSIVAVGANADADAGAGGGAGYWCAPSPDTTMCTCIAAGSALDMLRRLRWAAAFAEAKAKKEAEAAAAAATAAAAAELAIFDECT